MNRTIIAAVAGVAAGAAMTYALLDRDRPEDAQSIVRDIADVPKMSGEAASLHREQRFENLHSIEQVLALPTDFARTEAIYALSGRADSGTVQNLIYEANRIADPIDRAEALGILFSRLTELDAPSALAMATSEPWKSDRALERRVWQAWGRHDLDSALSAAITRPTARLRNQAAQALYSAFGYYGNDVTERIEQELGIRPDATMRARYLYDLADSSPQDAIDHIMGIASAIDQQNATAWLAHHLARTDPELAAGYAELFDDPQLEEYYGNVVARDMAAIDPAGILERLVAGYGERPDRRELWGAMRSLASQDIDSAMAYLDRLTSPQDRQMLGTTIAGELAHQDPVRALQWARSRDAGIQVDLISHVLNRIAQTDPQLALEEVVKIRNGQQRSRVVMNIAHTVARSDPIMAARFVEAMPSRQEREWIASSVASEWIRKDPDAAIQWLTSTDSVDSESVLQRLGRRLAQTDTDAAIRLLPKLDESSASGWRRQIAESLAAKSSTAVAMAFVNQYEGTEHHDELRAAMIGGIAQTDIYLARQLAEQLPAGNDRDAAYMSLVAHHADTNPTEAAGWLSSIEEDSRRAAATQSLAWAWNENDPDGAARWADRLPRGTQRDDAIAGLARSWKEMTPSRERLIDSIDDADKRAGAMLSRIQAIARTDWRKAQEMLDESGARGGERQRVQSMIHRYRDQ